MIFFRPRRKVGKPVVSTASSTGLHVESLEERMMLSTVTISAAGSEGGEQMRLLVNETEVQTWTVTGGADSGQTNSYSYTDPGTITADHVRIAFTNDQYDPGVVDFNLRVYEIDIDGVTWQTEDPSVFSTGTWLPSDGLQPGFRESEYLTNNGYFQFSTGSNQSTIKVRARGDEGGEQFRLIINDATVQTYTTTTSFQLYTYTSSNAVVADTIRIEFFDGVYEPANGIDENLVVDYVAIDNTIWQTESPTTYSTGTWLPADGITPGFRLSETLHADGYFHFDQGAGNSGSVVQVRARGDEGGEQFRLIISNSVVGLYSVSVVDDVFSYTANGDVSANQVRIEFINDRYDSAAGIDANLIVDYLDIDGLRYQTEDLTVFSTGTWRPEDGVVPGVRQSEVLHVNGYFQYGNAVANSAFDLNGQPVFQRNGHLYLLNSVASSWSVAQTEAASLGGNLVTINDANEEEWLKQTFGNQTTWIGINDQVVEGQFRWANGEPVAFTHWLSGQPDNDGDQDFGRMNGQPNGQWDDVGDNEFSHFGIIEIGSAQSAGVQNGLLGEYYDDLNFGGPETTRVDSTVEFDWGSGAPLSGFGSDTFSVRWTGQVQAEFSELYTFQTRSDDGVRLWVNGQLIINEWNEHAATNHSGTISLESGQLYDMRLEYYEQGGDAVAQLRWSSASQSLQVIPQNRLIAASEVSHNPNGSGFTTEVVASGLDQPIAFAVAPDGRIFVTEKKGLVKIVENGVVVSTFLDINLEVQSGHDRGLMGIALDPDFASNGHVYLNFSEETNPSNPDDDSQGSDAAGRLIRISASAADPNIADLATRIDVLTGHQMTHYTHAVGDVDFDNQGNLIFTWGDGGFDPVLRLEAQDPDSKQGKLFRINRFTFEGVPENPFFDSANPDSTASKVWAVGVRNSWKLTVDRATGDVYMGEVTDGGPEEINVMRADGSTVANFGWPYFEDNNRTSYGNVPPNFSYERAFVALPHTNAGGGDSIVGGAVYRGNTYSGAYDGRYFFANFNQGILYTADQSGAYQQFGNAGDYAGLVDIQLGPDGHIWVMSLFTGKIERLVSSDPGSNNTDPVAVANASLTAGTGALTVTFQAGASTDSDGDTLQYAWDFTSDGQVDAGGASATWSYDTPGRNAATLIVMDGKGGADSTLVEIDVLSSPDNGNVALGQPTVQSPTEGDAIASRAVDGNTADINTSYSQTQQTRTPLWEVDLGTVRSIQEIQMFLPASAELSDYWILVSENPFSSGNLDAARNDPGVSAFQNTGSAAAFESLTVDTTGRFVRIQRAGENHVLMLSEVRVVGA